MATKMNMMRLVQEVRGFADMTKPRPQARSFGPLMLPLRMPPTRKPPNPKQFLRLLTTPAPDIPQPVAVRVIRAQAPR